MKKRIIDWKKSSEEKSRIYLAKGKFKEELEEIHFKAEIYDRAGNLIESSDKIIKNWHWLEVRVIFYIHPETWKTELQKGDVTYYFNGNYESEPEYRRCKKEALSRYLYEKIIPVAPHKKEIENKDVVNGIDRVSCIISKNIGGEDGEITVKVRNTNLGNDPSENTKDAKNFTLFARFNPNDSVEIDEFITFPSPSEPKDIFWTWPKTIGAFCVGAIILALLYFYRKKIWGWIKREDKTKKKEQVEIF